MGSEKSFEIPLAASTQHDLYQLDTPGIERKVLVLGTEPQIDFLKKYSGLMECMLRNTEFLRGIEDVNFEYGSNAALLFSYFFGIDFSSFQDNHRFNLPGLVLMTSIMELQYVDFKKNVDCRIIVKSICDKNFVPYEFINCSIPFEDKYPWNLELYL